MTATAEAHLKKAVRDTKQIWGIEQARTYAADLLEGFQYIAENHLKFHSPHRTELTKDTRFSVHLVAHRYVAFQVYDKNTVIICGLFHERMDIPTRLDELQSLTQREIEALQRELGAR
jgi:plasmid stabilization system protein ParE